MNTHKLLAAGLCVMACTVVTISVDAGNHPRAVRTRGNSAVSSSTASDALASPSVTISDPVNPKPGMVFNGYNMRYANVADMPSVFEKVAAVKTTIVADGKFSYEYFKDVEISQGVWEGFLKCKRSANCTVLVRQARYNGCWYGLFINGKKIVTGHGQTSATVDLKVGFNHILLVAQNAGTHAPVSISLKATDSTREPKPLTPKDLWYDEKPDEGDVF